MDATRSGLLFTPYSRLLDNLYSRVVVTGPDDLSNTPGGRLSAPQGDTGTAAQSAPATADTTTLSAAAGTEAVPADTVATQAGFVAASYTSRQSTSLVINTQEGDRVTIDITRQATVSRTEVAGLAGNAGFSNVQNSRQTYRAVAAYQQSQPAVAKQPEAAAATPSLTDAAALGGDVRGLIDTAAAATPLASPANAVADIFTTLTNDRAAAFGKDALKSDAMSMLHDLVSRIVDSYRSDRSDETDEGHEPDDSQPEEVAEHAA